MTELAEKILNDPEILKAYQAALGFEHLGNGWFRCMKCGKQVWERLLHVHRDLCLKSSESAGNDTALTSQ